MTGPKVIQMPGGEDRKKKVVPCRQADIDAIPYGSGDWTVEGIPGLIIRAGAREKSFRLQRRVKGRLVRKVLGPMSAAQARRIAMQQWAALKPPPAGGKVTLAQAWEDYLRERPLAEVTRKTHRYCLRHYMAGWEGRTLDEIGNDRAGLRRHYHDLIRRHGAAAAGLAIRSFRAVYNYARRADPDLPPPPTEAIDLILVKPRDWALSDDELRAWWAAVQRLNPLKQAFWKTMLLTGARRGSVEALRWEDIDFERRIIRFSTAKGGRTYSVPGCEKLIQWLRAWREHCPPSEARWVFPSPIHPERHIVVVSDVRYGVASAHHLRHTYRTVLAELGASPDQARLLLGHSLGGDVSRGYITAHLLVESLRPLAEAVAERYGRVLRWYDE